MRFWGSDIKENVIVCADEIEAKYKEILIKMTAHVPPEHRYIPLKTALLNAPAKS